MLIIRFGLWVKVIYILFIVWFFLDLIRMVYNGFDKIIFRIKKFIWIVYVNMILLMLL